MFLKNKNIIFKIRRPKVTDYAALKFKTVSVEGMHNRRKDWSAFAHVKTETE